MLIAGCVESPPLRFRNSRVARQLPGGSSFSPPQLPPPGLRGNDQQSIFSPASSWKLTLSFKSREVNSWKRKYKWLVNYEKKVLNFISNQRNAD